MEEHYIDCKPCSLMPPDVRQYAARTCNLCGNVHCDECLNEAGYCTPCSEKMGFSKEEAISV